MIFLGIMGHPEWEHDQQHEWERSWIGGKLEPRLREPERRFKQLERQQPKQPWLSALGGRSRFQPCHVHLTGKFFLQKVLSMMGSSGSDHAPSSVLCRAPPCHGSPSSPPSPHAGKFIGRWWMIWTEIAPIWGYYENVVEKNGNGNCRLIFLPSSPSSTSTRMFLPQTPRWVGWASIYPATFWQLDMTNNHDLDITKNHHPDNKTSYFHDIKNNHQLANQAPAGPPIPTSAASRYPPPSSQQRNPQFTSLEVIIIKMSPFPCCWLCHFPSSGGETSWGRRCRVDFSTNPSVRFSPLHNPQRNPFPPRKRAPTSGSKSWGPERLMTDQWKQGLANIFGHN